MVAMLGTFIVYGHKKHLINKATAQDTDSILQEIKQDIDEMKSDVAKVKLSAGAQKLR